MINRKQRRRLMLAGLVTGAILTGAVIAYGLMHVISSQAQVTTKHQVSDPVKEQEPSKVVNFAAMGDMLAHDTVVANAREGESYNFSKYFSEVAAALKNRDAIFCNPETPVAGKQLGISGYPTFNAPQEFARDLKGIGCNVINLATNHMYDKSAQGIEQSLEVWNSLKPLAVSGANTTPDQQRKVSYFDKNGLKIAFVAFADFSNVKDYAPYQLNLYHDENLVRSLLTEASKQADIVLVSAHWGAEDSTEVTTSQAETARLFSELGADVVIGTGPHVLQKVEKIKTGNHETLVWYSIGNMLSSQLTIDQLTGGIASFTIKKQNDKTEIKDITFYPTFMGYQWSSEDRDAQNLTARSNLKLYPLAKSQDVIPKMFPGKNVDERREFVTKTLGDAVRLSD